MSEEKIMMMILGIGLIVLLFAGGIATVIAAFSIIFIVFLGVDVKGVTVHHLVFNHKK